MQILKPKNIMWLAFFLPIIVHAQVSEFELDNGLKLIVKEDHRAPVVTSQIWYKVGSSNEHNGITGISHMLEHMLFKGRTNQLKSREFSKIIARHGGDENAFTGRDFTAYFQNLHKDHLEISLKYEADLMRNLIIDPADVFTERNVVAEERRQTTEGNPQSVLEESLFAAAFVSSPYHHPVIGWMSDIQHVEAEDLQEWYRMWYAPNNATLVVVGDVEPKAVLELAEQYFGPLKPEKIAKLKPRAELPQMGLREVKVTAPAELPYLMMAWKIPSLPKVPADSQWEPYALEVLAAILDGSKSSRFTRTLVREQQVAAGVSAGNSAFSKFPGLFVVDGTPANGRSVDEFKTAILEQIDRLKHTPVSKEELERVKTMVMVNNVYERDNLFFQAMQIGMLESVGLGWIVAEQFVDNIKAVTAEQVQIVANKYFIDDSLTIAELVPLPLDGRLPGSNPGGGHVR